MRRIDFRSFRKGDYPFAGDNTAEILPPANTRPGSTVRREQAKPVVQSLERIRGQREVIPEQNVIEFVEAQQSLIEKVQPSFFEVTVAMAFDYFAKAQVDVAIIEVGLGGRLDSTNIIRPELCLITNIGMDHMNLLGNTLQEIAGEKAGIIKANTPVVISERDRRTAQQINREDGNHLYRAVESYCDTGHNEDGIEVLTICNLRLTRYFCVMGAMKDKDLEHILPLLPKEAIYYFSSPDMPRAMPAEELSAAALSYGLQGKPYSSVMQALTAAKQAYLEGDLVFIGDTEGKRELLDSLNRAPKQQDAVLAYLQLSKTSSEITRQAIMEAVGCGPASITALIDKGIFLAYCGGKECTLFIARNCAHSPDNRTGLNIFGDQLGVYHSNSIDNERAEVWHKVIEDGI
ncbi:hypothetical protein FQR65_LT19660 [Abscondita terminalis]|nr:hypothetical protein FQR65_LT19660 [Abscondita terminalis]